MRRTEKHLAAKLMVLGDVSFEMLLEHCQLLRSIIIDRLHSLEEKGVFDHIRAGPYPDAV